MKEFLLIFLIFITLFIGLFCFNITLPNSTELVSNLDVLKTLNSQNERTVYLTFDDGPSYITPKILEILDNYNIKATFFVTGFNPEYENYIKIAYDKGHTIGMHTYCHLYENVYSSVDNYFEDLNRIAEICTRQIGFVPKYIRFPGGSSNKVSIEYCKKIMSQLTSDIEKNGYQYYDWNVSADDAVINITSEKIIENIYRSNLPKDIVLLVHDSNGKEPTVEALPKIIEYYTSIGYIFKPIDNNTPIIHHNTIYN